MNSGLLYFRLTWSESYFVKESGGEEGPGTSLDDVVQNVQATSLDDVVQNKERI